MNLSTSTPGPSMPSRIPHIGISPSSTAPLVPKRDQHYYSLTSFYDSLPHVNSQQTMQAPISSSFNLVNEQRSNVSGLNSYPFVNTRPRRYANTVPSPPMQAHNAVQADPSAVRLPVSRVSLSRASVHHHQTFLPHSLHAPLATCASLSPGCVFNNTPVPAYEAVPAINATEHINPDEGITVPFAPTLPTIRYEDTVPSFRPSFLPPADQTAVPQSQAIPENVVQQQLMFPLRLPPPLVVGPCPVHPSMPLRQGLLTPGGGNVTAGSRILPRQLPVPSPVLPQPVPQPLFQNFPNVPHNYFIPQQYVPQLPPVQQNAPIGRGNFFSNRPVTVSSSSLSIIPLLTEVRAWTPWNNGVINAVRTIGALGHLFEGQSNDPLLRPIYPPTLPGPNASDADWAVHSEFWQIDATVVQILTSHLGTAPATALPSATDIALQRRTAREIYALLSERYSGNNYADGLVCKMQLWNTKYSGGAVEHYITTWKEGIDHLRRCQYPYMPADAAIHFILHGPMQIDAWQKFQPQVLEATQHMVVDDRWLDELFRTASLDMHVSNLAKSIDTALRTTSTPHPNSRRSTQSRDSAAKRVCDECQRKGHVRCPIDGWDHCEHHHHPGGGRCTHGLETKPDADKTPMTSSKLKALVSAAVLETLDEDESE